MTSCSTVDWGQFCQASSLFICCRQVVSNTKVRFHEKVYGAFNCQLYRLCWQINASWVCLHQKQLVNSRWIQTQTSWCHESSPGICLDSNSNLFSIVWNSGSLTRFDCRVIVGKENQDLATKEVAVDLGSVVKKQFAIIRMSIISLKKAQWQPISASAKVRISRLEIPFALNKSSHFRKHCFKRRKALEWLQFQPCHLYQHFEWIAKPSGLH